MEESSEGVKRINNCVDSRMVGEGGNRHMELVSTDKELLNWLKQQGVKEDRIQVLANAIAYTGQMLGYRNHTIEYREIAANSTVNVDVFSSGGVTGFHANELVVSDLAESKKTESFSMSMSTTIKRQIFDGPKLVIEKASDRFIDQRIVNRFPDTESYRVHVTTIPEWRKPIEEAIKRAGSKVYGN